MAKIPGPNAQHAGRIDIPPISESAAPRHWSVDKTSSPLVRRSESEPIQQRSEPDFTDRLTPEATSSLPSAPAILKQDGDSVLKVWELDPQPVYFTDIVPDEPAFVEYRTAIRNAGAVTPHPRLLGAQNPKPGSEEIWRRELANQVIAYSGEAGKIRPINYLEALLFAHQAKRFSQIDTPTEFIAAIVTKGSSSNAEMRIYFSGSASIVPPKEFYPFDRVERDVTEGWSFAALLHNHTVQVDGGQLALGVPVPSTSDVQLFRSLADRLGLETVLVTNGFFTGEVPTADLDAYFGPPEPTPI